MSDLRELLREAHKVLWLVGPFVQPQAYEKVDKLRSNIDAALAQQPEPEPLFIGHLHRFRLDPVVSVVETLPEGTRLYAIPPSAAALIAEKDAEIEQLKERNREWSALAEEEEALRHAAERALAQIKEVKPDWWIVIDEMGQPCHTATWPEFCHEHINEAINEHKIEEASTWVVRPAYAAPQPPAGKGDLVPAGHFDGPPNPPNAIPREIHDRLVRDAKREALREAADKIEAQCKELGVLWVNANNAPSELRAMASEHEREKPGG